MGDVYQLASPLVGPYEVIKLAVALTSGAGRSNSTPADDEDSDALIERILVVIANVESGMEEAALLSISPPTEGLSARIDAIVPIYDDFKVAFEQIDASGASAEDDPLATASQPVQAHFAADFTSDRSRFRARATIRNLDELEDLLRETRRLTEIAESEHLDPSARSHTWLSAYTDTPPEPVRARSTTSESTTSVSSALFSLGSKAIDGLPALASTFSSFGFFSGTNAQPPPASEGMSRGIISDALSHPPPLPPRRPRKPPLDPHTAEMLSSRRSEYVSSDEFKMHICTFNTNGQFYNPSVRLREWVRPENEPDLVVVGLQEMDLRPEVVMIRHDLLVGEAWSSAILQCLHEPHLDKKEDDAKEPPGYILLETKQLAGIWIALFAKQDRLGDLGDLSTTSVMTGFAGFAGNKGACCVRLRIHDSYVHFANAHLAAFQDGADKRNFDFHDISKRAIFAASSAGRPFSTSALADCDLCVFFGDLNYRIDMPIDAIRSSIKRAAWPALLEHDQLKLARRHESAFEGYEEGDIAFQPTYKFDKGTDTYDSSEKQRRPAYTDRVLWRRGTPHADSSDSDGHQVEVHVEEYTSSMDARLSDHKPVLARLRVTLARTDRVKRQEIIDELQRKGPP